MTRSIVFLHGAWVTPACWDPFRGYFTERGFRTHAPAWPGKDRSVAAIRADPDALTGLGGAQIIDHYADYITDMPEPPILIGHSFGGLFVQVLLSRGLGAAGVAINSAPPKGVMVAQPTAVKSLANVIARPSNRRKVVRWSFEQFRYACAHTLPEADARAAYDTHITPETGRIFFQNAAANLNPRSPFVVDFTKPDRAPLLMIAGEKDHIVPASLNRANHRRYRNAATPVDFVEFPERTHWILAQTGWEEVAGHIAEWLGKHTEQP